MNYQKIINKIYPEVKAIPDDGTVASYIPELAKVDPNKFGVHLMTLDQQHFGIGDCEEKFSIQSIAKVLSLVLAYKIKGGHLWERVGVEPSGNPFNSLVQLEHDEGIPRNPLINAGAIVVCDILLNLLEDPKNDFIAFIRALSHNPDIDYNQTIANSEKSVGYRNTALINLMKAFGNIHHDVEVVMDFYFDMCSIEMTCHELSRTFLFLANDGKDPISGEEILDHSRSKRLNALMQTCGFYDEAGEFSFKVGLPGKSGVAGGIVAVYPDYFSMAVWSPRLNEKGNSVKGLKFLELFTSETGLSIF